MSNKQYKFGLFVLLFLILPNPVVAENKKFIFPVGCTYGEDCWAVNYVDVDVEDGRQDFKCNQKTYDGHKGTDFALGSIAQMRAGVDVLAAASGKVLRVRDGESDTLKTRDEMEGLKERKKECGNGVLIDHGDGLQTIYCHLKKGSVVVEADQRVKAGESIAQVGQSGMAEFPHLHFGVIWEGGIVDPYTGALNTEGCNAFKESMWHIGLPIDYEPVAIFDGGFRSTVPDFEIIKRGEANPPTLSLKSAAFVFWVGFYNVEKDDVIDLVIVDPDGQAFTRQQKIVKKNRARQFYYTGRKIGRVQLKSGVYKGVVRLTRTGGEGISREKTFTVKVGN